ncbi:MULTISPECIES: plasmid pRiA4b ORF-3 family protein [unclassified Polaromonas]|uniref:plasmid pRiA4b ORF-3 family protein n=1 Tax=unclassified Polaromonas TaxID=2638319 RepID=UPI001A1FCD18|nr:MULTISPECIES: plasmid pRiA4b ORF-3 family protein [unclassified Polaromonas]MBG6073795.1 hypothetical protein [Polaromonas sp. CG_9.7]MBG6115761.1 hypothetical protein [Polaromonas sp. CG_9.2]
MTAQLFKLPSKNRSKSTKSYQLRVELKSVKPAVWRRIAVPGTIKLSKLHHILLAAMGWQGGHLHEFIFADAMYGDPLCQTSCRSPVIADDPHWSAIHDNKSTFN